MPAWDPAVQDILGADWGRLRQVDDFPLYSFLNVDFFSEVLRTTQGQSTKISIKRHVTSIIFTSANHAASTILLMITMY